MRKSSWAIASVIIGIVSFVQLLGIEKAILSVIFGVLALKEIERESSVSGRKIAYWGISLGVLYIVIIAVLSGLHYPSIITFLKNAKKI